MVFAVENPDALQLPDGGRTDPSYLVSYWTAGDVAEQYEMARAHDSLIETVPGWDDLDDAHKVKLVTAVCDALASSICSQLVTDAILDTIRDNIPAAADDGGEE